MAASGSSREMQETGRNVVLSAAKDLGFAAGVIYPGNMEDRRYWVYILVSASGDAMYIGVTNNLENRLHQHRTGKGSLFARKYRASKLVYAEEYENPSDAIAREKQLKGWRRERKNDLVRIINPQFRELLPERPWPISPALRASGPSPSAQDD